MVCLGKKRKIPGEASDLWLPLLKKSPSTKPGKKLPSQSNWLKFNVIS